MCYGNFLIKKNKNKKIGMKLFPRTEINDRFFVVVENECVHCTIGTECLNTNDVKRSLQRVKLRFDTAGSTPSQTHFFF